MDTSITEKKVKVQAIFLLIILALVWGASFILMKKGLVKFTPFEVGVTRIGVASIVLMPVAIFYLTKIDPRNWWKFLVCGIVGNLLPSLLFAFAGTKLNSAVSGALNGLTPLFALLVGWLVFKIKLFPNQWIGVTVGLIGAIVLAASKGGIEGLLSINKFAVFPVIATVCYAFNVYLLKFWLGEFKPLAISSLAIFFSGFPMLMFLVFNIHYQETVFNDSSARQAFYSLITLGVVGTAISLVCFNYLVQITSPVFASSVTYLIPVVALLWGLADGEIIGINHFFGILFIIGGIVLVNKKISTKKPIQV